MASTPSIKPCSHVVIEPLHDFPMAAVGPTPTLKHEAILPLLRLSQGDPQPPTGELRLRAAVESSPSGILMIDAAGRIVLVNREVERLFGYPREELLGQPIELLVPEQLREHHPAHRGAFFHDPKVRSMGAGRELFGRRKDGSQVPVEIGLTPVATEEGMFVLSSIVDITARKRRSEERRVGKE